MGPWNNSICFDRVWKYMTRIRTQAYFYLVWHTANQIVQDIFRRKTDKANAVWPGLSKIVELGYKENLLCGKKAGPISLKDVKAKKVPLRGWLIRFYLLISRQVMALSLSHQLISTPCWVIVSPWKKQLCAYICGSEYVKSSQSNSVLCSKGMFCNFLYPFSNCPTT